MKKILIVDDEPTILMTLSHLLSSKETTVITSSRMEEAEEALSTVFVRSCYRRHTIERHVRH